MTFMFSPAKSKYLSWRAANVIPHDLTVKLGDDWHMVEQLYKVANFKGAYSSSRNEPPDIATGKNEVLQIHTGVWRYYNSKANFTAESFPPTTEAQSTLDDFLMKFREKNNFPCLKSSRLLWPKVCLTDESEVIWSLLFLSSFFFQRPWVFIQYKALEESVSGLPCSWFFRFLYNSSNKVWRKQGGPPWLGWWSKFLHKSDFTRTRVERGTSRISSAWGIHSYLPGNPDMVPGT